MLNELLYLDSSTNFSIEKVFNPRYTTNQEKLTEYGLF